MNVNIKQKKKLKHRQKEYKKSLKFNKVKKRGHSKKRKAFQLSVLLNTLPIIFFIIYKISVLIIRRMILTGNIAYSSLFIWEQIFYILYFILWFIPIVWIIISMFDGLVIIEKFKYKSFFIYISELIFLALSTNLTLYPSIFDRIIGLNPIFITLRIIYDIKQLLIPLILLAVPTIVAKVYIGYSRIKGRIPTIIEFLFWLFQYILIIFLVSYSYLGLTIYSKLLINSSTWLKDVSMVLRSSYSIGMAVLIFSFSELIQTTILTQKYKLQYILVSFFKEISPNLVNVTVTFLTMLATLQKNNVLFAFCLISMIVIKVYLAKYYFQFFYSSIESVVILGISTFMTAQLSSKLAFDNIRELSILTTILILFELFSFILISKVKRDRPLFSDFQLFYKLLKKKMSFKKLTIDILSGIVVTFLISNSFIYIILILILRYVVDRFKSSINYIFEIEDSFSEILKFDFIFLVILFTIGSKEAVDILTGYLLPAIWMMVIKITLMYDSLLKNDKQINLYRYTRAAFFMSKFGQTPISPNKYVIMVMYNS